MRSAAAQQHHERAPGTGEILDSIAEAAPAALIALGPLGEVILWNRVAERMFGWTADEVLGRRAPILRRDDEAEFDRLLGLLGGDVEPIPRRGTFLRRDGSHVELTSTLVPIRDAHHRIAGATLAVFEPGLAQATESGGPGPYRMEALGRFAAGVAHDVNNVLTAIGGYADLLATELPASASAQADLDEIRRATDRAAALMRQLLTFGRRLRQNWEAVEIDAVVSGVEPMLRRLAGDRVELVVVRSGGPEPILADRGQLEGILTNLIVNAADAMPGGGRITIATAQVTLDDAFVDRHPGSRPGQHVRLTVRDTGVGMDDATLAHVFEPYFTTKPEGTGLGLATVYGAVKQHGGYILAESAPGAGTTMTVYLPRQ